MNATDKDVRKRIEIIETNLLTLCLLKSDLNYLSDESEGESIEILMKYKFFWRIWKGLYCMTIIESCIMISSKESFSLYKLIKILISNHSNIQWKNKLELVELQKIESQFKSLSEEEKVKNLKYIRDKGITHHDFKIENIGIKLKEINEILDFLFISYNKISYALYNKQVHFDFSDIDKGHSLLKDLERYNIIEQLIISANADNLKSININILLSAIRKS